jgi:hypothetical protein
MQSPAPRSFEVRSARKSNVRSLEARGSFHEPVATGESGAEGDDRRARIRQRRGRDDDVEKRAEAAHDRGVIAEGGDELVELEQRRRVGAGRPATCGTTGPRSALTASARCWGPGVDDDERRLAGVDPGERGGSFGARARLTNVKRWVSMVCEHGRAVGDESPGFGNEGPRGVCPVLESETSARLQKA